MLSTASAAQLLTWIVVLGALLPLELAEAHRGYEVNRRYGPPATKVKPAASQSVQTWQQQQHQQQQLQYDRSVTRERDRQTPRYLDIGLHSLQQLDSDLLFPDPALFNAETKAVGSQQVEHRPIHPYNYQHYQYSQHNKYNDHLLEQASNINYPVRYNRRPYKLKPAAWNYLQYDQNVGATAESGPTSVSCCSGNSAWTPLHVMSRPAHFTMNTQKTRVNEREPSKVSLFLPMADPEYAAAVVHADQSQLVTQTMPSLLIQEQITSSAALPPPETLLIPVPRENATTIVTADAPQVMNVTDSATTVPAANSDQPLVISVTSSPAFESPASPPSPPTVNQPTVQQVAQSSSPTQPPVNQPTVQQPVASTAKPVRNQAPAATTEKAKPPSPPPPQRQPAEPKPPASKPAADSPPPPPPPSAGPVASPPSTGPVASPPSTRPVASPPQANPVPAPPQPPAPPPQIAPPAIDSTFTAPSRPPLVNVPEVQEAEPSGVPGDLPLFEEGGAGIAQDVGSVASPAEAAAGGGGEESPFPGLFSEFLNQVADMIEEFQPTTELPLADEPFGGEASDALQGAGNLDGGPSNFGQESVLSGDTVGGFPNDLGGVGGQDGGDLGGVGDFPGNDFGGDTAGSEFGGGSPIENVGGDPQANNPVPQSVPNDPSGTQSASSNSVGQQAAPASTNSAPSPPSPAKGPATPAAAQSSPPIAEQAEYPPIPSAQYGSPNEQVHYQEGAAAAAPDYANGYANPSIASQPQIHPPMINDYVDPMMMPYDSVPMPPDIGASLSSNGAHSSEGGEFHHREQALNGGGGGDATNYNGGETAEVAVQSEGNYQQEQYEGGGAATTAAAAAADSAYDTSGGVTAQYPAHVDIYNPGSAGSVYEPIPVSSNYAEGTDQVAVNGTTYEYGDEYAVNDTTLTAEEQPLVPVANHLEVHVSQSVWTSSSTEQPPSPPPSASYSTSTTFAPSSVTFAQNEGSSSSSSTEPSSYVHSTDASTLAGRAMNDRHRPSEVYRKESSKSEQHMDEKMTSNPESDTSTVREYVPPRFLVPHSSNHVDDYAEDPEPETVSSVGYSAEGSPQNGVAVVVEDEAADAEGIPSEILPEVEANINLDLKKTSGFAEKKDDGNKSTPSS